MVNAYFLSSETFEIKDFVEIQDYEINIDEETNAKSDFAILQKPNAKDGDFIFVKEDEKMIYQGIIDSPTNNGGVKWEFTAKYITNLFDRKILVQNASLIASDGIEDFIAYTIENEFTNSTDTLLNLDYLDVEIETHTKKQFSISAENGIYNFHTFINNMTQKYNIVYEFDISNEDYEGNRLKMTIKSIEDVTEDLIDCNFSDITDYDETYQTKVLAKVSVKSSDDSVYTLYLLNDRTTTTDASNPNRAIGDIDFLYEENSEDARQTALNAFKSNSYEHLIQFRVNSNSQIFDVKNWVIGKKVKIKNKTNEVIDSYISAISKKIDNPFWEFKTGNIRIDFIDKLKQERS